MPIVVPIYSLLVVSIIRSPIPYYKNRTKMGDDVLVFVVVKVPRLRMGFHKSFVWICLGELIPLRLRLLYGLH